MSNYPVKTNIKTLKAVWNILQGMSLDGLLTGEATNININSLLDDLLRQNMLEELLQVITGTTDDFKDLELKEVTAIMAAFFAGIKEAVSGLVGTALMPSAPGVLPPATSQKPPATSQKPPAKKTPSTPSPTAS